jgi:hypothetical protein
VSGASRLEEEAAAANPAAPKATGMAGSIAPRAATTTPAQAAIFPGSHANAEAAPATKAEAATRKRLEGLGEITTTARPVSLDLAQAL